MSHFVAKIVPAGDWGRLDGSVGRGDRPHILPESEAGMEFLIQQSLGQIRDVPGIARGVVFLDNPEQKFLPVFRLASGDADYARRQVDALNKMVDAWRETAK